jgi:membrane-bound metal-dependent hydrolase YbcI (DUF457 family)
MNRKGHVGMTLLAFAPAAYLLITDGKLVLAVLGWLGIHAVEPLPDQDFHLPFLTHRSLSHSLVAVLVVGGILGAVGWLLGDRLFDWLYAFFSVGGTLWGQLLDHLPELSTSILTTLVPNIPPGEIVATIKQQAGGTVDRRGFAMFGFFIGAGGVLAHLLGDVITTQGIKPFLPLSRWQLSLSSLRADSPTANSGLFFLGVAAVVVVVGATVPGIILGAMTPAHLSPIGVASAQDTGTGAGPLVAPNGSVAINETQSNRTRIVLDSVALPQNGYIVAQTVAGSNVTNQSATKATVVGHTQFVRSGSYQDVVLQLNQSVPVGTTVSVTLHNDTDGDETLDVGTGKADGPYRTSDGSPIHDSISIEPAGKPRANASVAVSVSNQTSIQTQNTTNSSASTSNGNVNVSASATVIFRNQTTNGTSVTISSVTLPKGGFIAVHTDGYATGPAPAESSVIAVSQYLSAGTHRNVTIDISHAPPSNPPGLNRSQINESQTLAAVAYRDSNTNHRFDFVASFGENDSAFVNNGSIVADSARVRVPSPPPQTASVVFRNQTLQNRTLVVARARLPRGGFLVAHNASLRRTGDAVTSVAGSSRYLPPGNYTSVPIRLPPGALSETQVVTIRPSLDTNGNQQYDFVRSQGFRDVAYENRSGSQSRVVTASAVVRVPGSDRATQTRSETLTPTPGQTMATSPTTAAGASPTTAAGGGVKASNAPFGLSWLQFGVGALVVVVVLPTFIRRFR